MNKKPINKLVSVILTVAVCITTVFGCFVSVSAAETPSYIITGAQCNQNDTVASALVEFSVPQGIAAGIFTIDNTDNWYSSVAVSLYSELTASTDSVNIDSDNGNVTFYITDANGNAKLYTNIVFKLDFVFADGGIQEDIDITISGLDFNGLYYDEIYTDVDFTGTNGLFTAGCRHSFVVSDEEVYTSEELGYTVFNGAVCSQCGETKNDYQVVPNAETSGEIVIYTGSASTAPAVELLDANSANSESNPYIIETPTQIHSLAMGALKNTAGEVLYNKGAYFKVADGISAFILQSSADVETIMNLSSADEVKTYLSNLSGKTSWWTSFTGSNGQFSGHFDGNGVEIYGLYGAAAGAPAMFPVVTGTSSFKNFTIKNSYFSANSGAGVAAVVGKTPNDTVVDTITFNNVTVANNYIEQTGNHAAGASAIIGVCNSNTNSSNATQRDAAKIYNCLVYGNNIVNDAFTGTDLRSGLITDCSGNSEIKNVISLGVTPWTLNSGGWYLKQIGDGTIANVFTDASQEEWNAYSASNVNNSVSNAQIYNINYAINPDDLKGDKAAVTTATLTAANKAANSGSKGTDLDWNTKTNPNGIWFTGNVGQYPSLLKKAVLDVADSTNYEWKLLGVNIEYQNDGGFTLNFHFESSYDTDISLYLANANEEYKSQILTEYTTSSFAGTTLSADAKMFTVSNLSAKDMDILWLPTIVATSKTGNKTVYSETKQISITDYATAVVSGECFYDEDATEEEKSADKTVAAALINYSEASKNALANTKAPTTVDEAVVYNGSASTAPAVELLDANSANSEGNPYIIETPAQLHALAIGALKNKNGELVSEIGAYFKVKDGIKAFVMQSNTAVTNDIIALSSGNAVKDYFTKNTPSTRWWSSANSSGKFSGHFDGNGVEIYGICVNDTGATAMFSTVYGNSSFKNFTVKNSYFKAGSTVAAIVGNTTDNNNDDTDFSTGISFENISIINNYICSTSTNEYGASALAGYFYDRAYAMVNNCLIYGNSIDNDAYEDADGDGVKTKKSYSGLITRNHGTGWTNQEITKNAKIQNVLALGVTPWTVSYNGSAYSHQGGYNLANVSSGVFKNIYTDQSKSDLLSYNSSNNSDSIFNSYTVKIMEADAFKGVAAMSNMSALDWENVWLYGAEGEYPSIVLADGKVNPISEYSGTPDTASTLSGSGSSTDPYIIETADQFAAIALGKKVYAQGSYFKVKPGVKAFYMNGGGTVAAMTSGDDVKTYFETNGGYGWTSSWDNSTADKSFSGHFDGSGVTIYGLYDADYNSGLFEMAEDSSSFKNFALKNSYIKVGSGAGVAAIVGKVSKQSDPDIMAFENIIVANNHIEQTNTGSTGASIVLGYLYNSNDGVSINKCIIYGNNLVNPNPSATCGLVSAGGNGSASLYRIRNVVALGVKPYTNGQGWYLRVLDDNGCFVNIYTDQDCSAMNNYSEANKTTYNFNDNIDASLLQGSSAITTLGDEFDWDTTWFVGSYGEYPSLTPTGTLPSSVQTLYDNVTFNSFDNYGNSTNTFGVYTTALSLKANPYISFAFAFHGDYKVNRDKIKIRFTYTENGANVTSGEVSVPAYNGEDIVNVNGWTNTAKNGRYHTYKAENIPVEALANGIKVEANYNNTGWIDFGTYSAEGLGIQFERLNRNNPCDYYETRVEAVKALLFYVQAIQSRYGAQ